MSGNKGHRFGADIKDYYKLFVPPTYYFAPVEQALAIDWEPSDQLGMTACDSLAQARGKFPLSTGPLKG